MGKYTELRKRLKINESGLQDGTADRNKNWRETVDKTSYSQLLKSHNFKEALPSKTWRQLFWIKRNLVWCSTRQRIRGSPTPIIYQWNISLQRGYHYHYCTFTDDIAIIAEGNSIEEAAEKLPIATDKINCWTKR